MDPPQITRCSVVPSRSTRSDPHRTPRPEGCPCASSGSGVGCWRFREDRSEKGGPAAYRCGNFLVSARRPYRGKAIERLDLVDHDRPRASPRPPFDQLLLSRRLQGAQHGCPADAHVRWEICFQPALTSGAQANGSPRVTEACRSRGGGVKPKPVGGSMAERTDGVALVDPCSRNDTPDNRKEPREIWRPDCSRSLAYACAACFR